MVPKWEAGSLSYAGLKILHLTLHKMTYFTYTQEGKRHSQLPGPESLGNHRCQLRLCGLGIV